MSENTNPYMDLVFPQDYEPPSDEALITARDLQALLAKLFYPLQNHLFDLRAIVTSQAEEIAALRLKLASLEQSQDTLGENQLIQLRLIHQLRKEPEEESPLIDELYRHMCAVGLKQTTFAGAAKILKRSKGRIKQLHPLLAMDQRFIILPSESHKQRLLIRLREFYERV